MTQLYYSPGTASLAPHFILEELALTYELVLVDTSKQEHQQTPYLKLNPLGKIPLFVDGENSMTESAAICLHICDKNTRKTPDFFHPAITSASRAQLYKWLLYLSNTLQAELVTYFYPDRLLADPKLAEQVKQSAEQRVIPMFEYIDQHFASSGKPYLLGDKVSAADFFLFMLGRWSRGMSKPARDYPHLGEFMRRMFAKKSVQTVFAQEGIQAPYF
ncbi:glutathione S-transferase [Undibacterium sp. LX40W]|uniref:Glutathione S-transferase n=1 Tax=Undibacterium nitidum TaxID=2762298 RepID=A0A923HLP2_9BURK|nr:MULTISPECIES: glutathione S-transferase [Undibacterium]MBC3881322.1 glutathione S-transferase [Undibacterium nitidum]MBC3891895.1 glutathione S-transferase [Undibacterium sp. LX40W]